MFYLGIILAVVGGGLVTKFKPNPAPKKPAAAAMTAPAVTAGQKPERAVASIRRQREASLDRPGPRPNCWRCKNLWCAPSSDGESILPRQVSQWRG